MIRITLDVDYDGAESDTLQDQIEVILEELRSQNYIVRVIAAEIREQQDE